MWKVDAEVQRERRRAENNPKTIYEWSNYLESKTQQNYFNNFDFYLSTSVSGSTIEVSFYFSSVNYNLISAQGCVDKLWKLMMSYASNCPYRIHLDKDNVHFR